jgi:hypothetical protein
VSSARALVLNTCEECGEEFHPFQHTQRWCTPECRKAAHLADRKARFSCEALIEAMDRLGWSGKVAT